MIMCCAICRSALWRFLDRHGITFKKSLRAAEQHRADVARARSGCGRGWACLIARRAPPGAKRRFRARRLSRPSRPSFRAGRSRRRAHGGRACSRSASHCRGRSQDHHGVRRNYRHRIQRHQGERRSGCSAGLWQGYEKAAAKDNATAMYNLGGLYYSGQGVAQGYGRTLKASFEAGWVRAGQFPDSKMARDNPRGPLRRSG